MITDLEGFIGIFASDTGFIEGDQIFNLSKLELVGVNFFDIILTKESKSKLVSQFHGEILPKEQPTVYFDC